MKKSPKVGAELFSSTFGESFIGHVPPSTTACWYLRTSFHETEKCSLQGRSAGELHPEASPTAGPCH